jgi:hypothetical protein
MQQQEQQIAEMIKRVAEEPTQASKEELLTLLTVIYNLSEGVPLTRPVQLLVIDAYKVLAQAISSFKEEAVTPQIV